MITLQLPWLLALLPLPLLVWWLLPAAPEGGGAALRVPFYERFAPAPRLDRKGPARARLACALKVAAWCLLVLAAARPTWIGEPSPVATEGRDLMLALDLSGSMETPDFEVQGRRVDRLSVVRAVAREFVKSREGDRVGLVLFGTRAYLQAPLTLDRTTVVGMIDETEIGLAGEETAIGDAVGIAVKHLRERPADERVLVLLSDGENTAGTLEPLAAADIAASAGVRIYTIGMGSGAQLVQTFFGNQLAPGSGGPDETTLREMAERTGGSYFAARDTASLIAAHAQIDALETSEGDPRSVRPEKPLFYWPLGVSLSLVSLLLAWSLCHTLWNSRVRFARDAAEGTASA